MIIATYSGQLIDLQDPKMHQIQMLDIAHSLSMQCRFNGHTHEFYSVAEHCVLGSIQAENDGYSREDTLGFLMHDAAEAYVSDLNGTIRQHHPSFMALEESLLHLICERFEIPPYNEVMVDIMDKRMLALEKKVAMANDTPWPGVELPDPAEITLSFWTPQIARGEFIRRFHALTE